jgi:AGZA family xanthine/uracil permease-like MFS transporter
MVVAAGASICGIIHSPLPTGAMYLPWQAPEPIVWQVAAGYLAMALVFAGMALGRREPVKTG